MTARPRTRLIVLYGGRSAEHEVSCISARHVVGAVDTDRYDLQLIGITTEGEWVDTTSAALSQATPRALPSPDEMSVRGATSREVGAVSALARIKSAPPDSPHEQDGGDHVVVLPLVHGPMGEDGTLQGLLELAGVPYCGPGVAGSATAMDKGLAKSLMTAAGLPQARYMLLHEGEADDRLGDRVGDQLGWPVFVKPANMGSSIGITKVAGAADLAAAIARATRYDENLVLEESVSGRELEIGVLGWPELRTSVPGEVKPSHDFYDFEDKYVDGSAGLEVPAQLPEGVAEEMSRLAIAACRALRVDSMARVDFFYEDGGRGLLINEVNTIPGFTPISMFPQMWAATGVGYEELIDTLVEQAVRRAARRRRFETGR